jgi:hypothetical protein
MAGVVATIASAYPLAVSILSCMHRGGLAMSARRYIALVVKLLVCAALISAVAATPASAAKNVTKCKGELPAGAYDNVLVQDNKTCTLFGATVDGNVTVGHGATLESGFATIHGSLIGQGATIVRLTGLSVEGDVSIRGGGFPQILSSTVYGVVDVSGMNGSIAIISNNSADALGHLRVVNNAVRPADPDSTVGLFIADNEVQADAEVSGNTGTVGKSVQGNRVGGTLSCIGNEPPFEGGFNTAATLEGQCKGPV